MPKNIQQPLPSLILRRNVVIVPMVFTSIALAIELFGSGGLLYFALACCVSYVLSGYGGLYSSQTILHSTLKGRYINVHTNDGPVETGVPEEDAAAVKEPASFPGGAAGAETD